MAKKRPASQQAEITTPPAIEPVYREEEMAGETAEIFEGFQPVHEPAKAFDLPEDAPVMEEDWQDTEEIEEVSSLMPTPAPIKVQHGQIRLLRDYRGKPSKEQFMQAGIYQVKDSWIKLANYLVENKWAIWIDEE